MTRFGKAPSQLVIEKACGISAITRPGSARSRWAWRPTRSRPSSGPKAGGCSSATRYTYIYYSGGENFISRNLVDIHVEQLPSAAVLTP